MVPAYLRYLGCGNEASHLLQGSSYEDTGDVRQEASVLLQPQGLQVYQLRPFGRLRCIHTTSLGHLDPHCASD